MFFDQGEFVSNNFNSTVQRDVLYKGTVTKKYYVLLYTMKEQWLNIYIDSK